MDNYKELAEQVDEASWAVRQKMDRLHALLKVLMDLRCFEVNLPEAFEDVYQLIQLAHSQSEESVNLSTEWDEVCQKVNRRLTTPVEGDRLPGELVASLFRYCSEARPDKQWAGEISMEASEFVRYAELDESLRPSVDFILELMARQGFKAQLYRSEPIGPYVCFEDIRTKPSSPKEKAA